MTDADIIQRVVGVYPHLKKKFFNPWRKDRKPGCYFEYRNDRLIMTDWGHREFHNMDVYQLVFYKKYGYRPDSKEDWAMAFQEYRSLGGEIFAGSKPLPKGYQYKRTYLDYIPKNWTKDDRKYWNQFGIECEQLAMDQVYSVSYFEYSTRQGNFIFEMPGGLCYVYDMWGGDDRKLYMPQRKIRFIGNVRKHCIYKVHDEGVHTDMIFVSKSYKDTRVANNLNWPCQGLQNEGILPAWAWMGSLNKKYIVFLFDKDAAGAKAVRRVVWYVREKLKIENAYCSELPAWAEKDPAATFHKMGENAADEALHYAYENRFIPDTPEEEKKKLLQTSLNKS